MEETSTTPDNNGTTIVEAVKTVDELTAEVASLTAQVVSLTADSEYKTGRVQFYSNRVNEFTADVTKLNELMNAKADEEDWCDKYDGTLAEWNGELVHIELNGRVKEYKEYQVQLDVILRYTHYITVEASSEDAARSEVDSMCDSDLLENLDYSDMYSTDVDIKEVEAQ